jgi:hypothetical protein
MRSIILRYATLLALLVTIVWLVEDFSWHPVVISIGLLATFIKLDSRLSPTPHLAGRWQYTVQTADREFSHRGDCTIQQAGPSVRIQGMRRATCTSAGGGGACRPVAIPWASDWAELCIDGVLRFDYHIALAESRHHGRNIEAICRLRLDSKHPSRMSGSYYTLPPFDESTLNCQWGTVTFSRISIDAELDLSDFGQVEEAEIEV